MTQQTEAAQPTASVDLPPAMAEMQSQSVEEVFADMNRMPLFMTTLDDTDGEGGDNVALEALKALAYEGTTAEIAENFRQQGNDCARARQWGDAKEFYDKAIAALQGIGVPKKKEMTEEEVLVEKMGQLNDKTGVIELDIDEEKEIDEEEERTKEKAIEEACHVNRALCNLEKKNYRSCIQDCAATLRLNPSNVKAYYRSATACLALDKIPEATDACERGLALDLNNTPLKTLSGKIASRKAYVESVEKTRVDREAKAASERATLKLALKSRGILTRSTDQAPDLEDASIKLQNPLDPSSTISFPVLLLYPADSQSDFIKAFSEKERLGQHLEYIFPLPWDQKSEYSIENTEAYMETIAGGLIKVGKNMSLGKVLGSGKPEVVDGLVRINVVPKSRATGWIEEFKKRRGH